MAKKLKYGVGVFEPGEFTARIKLPDGTYQTSKAYGIWMAMLSRCYDPKTQIKCKSYICCEVCDEWKHFQVFAKWYYDNIVEGYQLDKDILIKDNKLYSPNTCVFVPPDLNKLLERRVKDRGKYMIGVSIDKRGSRFYARCNILIDGKNNYKSLGGYGSEIEAFMAYKKAKEDNIKHIAGIYFKDGKITEKAYEALLRYKVETTD